MGGGSDCMNETVVLEMKGIDKRFPGVHALKRCSLSLRKGEVNALAGENGAGKSIRFFCSCYGY